MYRFLILFAGLLFALQTVQAQDADLYLKPPNSRYKMPEIPENMTLKEFQLLSRAVRVKDMAFAMIVPGYVHFRAHEPEWGYSLLGARVLGYAGLTVIASDSEYSLGEISRGILRWELPFSDEQLNSKKKTYQWVLGISSTLITGSYLTDVIGGHVQLKNKHEKIRYKYSMQMLQTHIQGQNFVPGIGLQVKF